MGQLVNVLIVTCMVFLPAVLAEKKPVTKLQIGVKKRIPADECLVKSRNGDTLHMHYTGTLHADGSQFDSSIPRGQPFTFPLGAGRVIKGWDQGLVGMCEGEKRKLIIPPQLGYGASGSPPKIPGDSVLVFEVELLRIERKGEL
jgi:FK506-binding protein 2